MQVEFCKSIIHSIAGLTYNEAQLILDDPKIHDPTAEGVRLLNKLAKIFRQRRMDAGALTLASPEVSTQHVGFDDHKCVAELAVESVEVQPLADPASHELMTGEVRARYGKPEPDRCANVCFDGSQRSRGRVYAAGKHDRGQENLEVSCLDGTVSQRIQARQVLTTTT